MEGHGALTAWPHTTSVLQAKVARSLAKPYTAGLGDTLFATQAMGEVTGHRQSRGLEYGVAAARVSAGLVGTTLVSHSSDLLPHLPHVRRRTLDLENALRPPHNLQELRRAITKGGGRPIVVADMDGTLTPPRDHITEEILSGVLDVLNANLTMVILTSSGIEAVHEQVLVDLCSRAKERHLRNLHVFAAQGSQGYRYAARTGVFECLFLLDLADPSFLGSTGLRRAKNMIMHAAERFNLPGKEEALVVDRSSQLTLMVLGRDATNDAKEEYDRNGGQTHRMQIAQYLNQCFEESAIDLIARPAGKSSINMTGKGVDKAFGIRIIAETLGTSASSMIYIGDEFWPGGADEPVLGQVMATINVGPSITPPAVDGRSIIQDVSLGTIGTKEVLTMLLDTQRTMNQKRRSHPSMEIAA